MRVFSKHVAPGEFWDIWAVNMGSPSEVQYGEC